MYLIINSIKNCLKNIYLELLILINHKLSCLLWYSISSKCSKKIHIGCGNNIITDFINIDIVKSADFRFDLRRKLPFNKCSMKYAFSEHTMEHFSYPHEFSHVLKEVYSSLLPQAYFDFSIPDFKKIILSFYREGNRRTFIKYMNDYKKRGHSDIWHTENDFIDLLVRQEGQHKYLYDFETIKRLCKEVGFTHLKIRKRLSYDSEERSDFSLLLRATK